jgi:hypothetical protein
MGAVMRGRLIAQFYVCKVRRRLAYAMLQAHCLAEHWIIEFFQWRDLRAVYRLLRQDLGIRQTIKQGRAQHLSMALLRAGLYCNHRHQHHPDWLRAQRKRESARFRCLFGYDRWKTGGWVAQLMKQMGPP